MAPDAVRGAGWRRVMAANSFAIAVSLALLLPFPATSVAAVSTLEPWSGAPAPALVLKDVEGRAHDLAAYRGKVVLINFWATWCVPCREEMPSIQRLRDKLAGQPFAALAVNVDEPDARVKLFIKQTGFDLPVLLDPNKTVTRSWGVRVLPVTFIVAKDGRLRYRLVGDLDWSSDRVVGIFTELLADRP